MCQLYFNKDEKNGAIMLMLNFRDLTYHHISIARQKFLK